MMTTIDELIAALESATCGSRELDADIAETMDLSPPGSFRMCGLSAVFGTGAYTSWTAPLYTSLLDAAVSLIPEGECWTIEEGSCWIRLMTPDDVDTFQGHSRGNTPIAICIAALRARADQPGAQGAGR